MKVETMRFVVRNEDEAYFLRAVHHLAGGCLLLGANDDAVTALLDVMRKAVEKRQRESSRSNDLAAAREADAAGPM